MKNPNLLSKTGHITRRGLLLGAGACAALGLCANQMAAIAQPLPIDTYQRVFFNAQEWAFIKAATARIIPSDGAGPGAIEAHVPIFIDKQMMTTWGQGEDWYRHEPFDPKAPSYTGYQAEPTPAQAYRIAIARIDTWCSEQYGDIFANLKAEQQDEALTRIEKDEVPIDEFRSSDFFAFLLQNTKEGYLADPIYGGNHDMAAWVYIGFPGARASFLEWVEKDNVKYRLGPVSLSGERA
ncbi:MULTISPECIES: gluconate 2-dehydrogenase subunit 3 family protein [unclassified Bartonella]|uniref:gluconate 2-dehydrogenase subunit 3 family protein n=1 Tax=unclassified Bartonella TaxID=2645622 RepID=UPI0015FE4ED8|nr:MULTISPECIES: gluconate 2-dehydrogenase subunit 3 family protein [unclassified Bartonella]UXN05896.1 gluconate 2-dehydrogenase subunit 3 family protein [Bartonella sp. HY761]